MCVNKQRNKRKEDKNVEIKSVEKQGGNAMPWHIIPLGFVKFRTKVV